MSTEEVVRKAHMSFLRIQLEALQERRRVAKEEGGSMGAMGAHDE